MTIPYQFSGGLGPFKIFPVKLPFTEYDITYTNDGIVMDLSLYASPAADYVVYDDFFSELEDGETFVLRAPLPEGSYNDSSLTAGNFYLRDDAADPQLFKYLSGPATNATVEPDARAEGPVVLRTYPEAQPMMRCTLVSGPLLSEVDDDLIQYSIVVRESWD
jgi:hypothetical protein